MLCIFQKTKRSGSRGQVNAVELKAGVQARIKMLQQRCCT